MNKQKIYIGQKVIDKEGNRYFVTDFVKTLSKKIKVELELIGVGFRLTTYMDLDDVVIIN